MFKRAGMRLFMLSAWKNEKGKLMVSSHDYNDEIGKGESFSQSSDWQTILPEWEDYAKKQFKDCSGKPKEPVPWKEVIPRHDQLIPPPYLPDGKKIREPSQMNRNEATEHLDFWYNRQQNSWDVVFEFYGWWSKADKEVKPSVFDTSPTEDHPAVTLPKETPGHKGMAATRTGRKSTVHVVIPPENSDEEDEGEEE
ncbi:hypothetical protein P692DRAFT_20878599 [Suillus brevipes Sb2]|nr:hypothetical protein P692DRAFT_20878599 [Suillus brevipes Sb2]